MSARGGSFSGGRGGRSPGGGGGRFGGGGGRSSSSFGRGGGFAGGRGRGGGGGRFGGSREPEGPPAEIVEAGQVAHECESELLCKWTLTDKVPYFNAGIYLDNKRKIGKVDEILGPITEIYFTVKMEAGVQAKSFQSCDLVYIGTDKLLPLVRFTNPGKPSGGRGGGGRGRGGPGGGRSPGRGRGSFGGRGGGGGRGSSPGGRGGRFGGRGGPSSARGRGGFGFGGRGGGRQ